MGTSFRLVAECALALGPGSKGGGDPHNTSVSLASEPAVKGKKRVEWKRAAHFSASRQAPLRDSGVARGGGDAEHRPLITGAGPGGAKRGQSGASHPAGGGRRRVVAFGAMRIRNQLAGNQCVQQGLNEVMSETRPDSFSPLATDGVRLAMRVYHSLGKVIP